MKKNQNSKNTTVAAPQIHRHKVALKVGNWKKYFDSVYVNTIIAMALNDFDDKNYFLINGYLITSQNLYLVVETTEKSVEEIVSKIEAKIIHLLKIHPQKLKKESRGEIAFIADEENHFYDARRPLFKFYPLENQRLVNLITGKKVSLCYFDRDLENLKRLIHNHPFCSAIHYLGGIGPVKVKAFRDQSDSEE